MNKNLIVWRDSQDQSTYHFGVKDIYGKAYIWFSLIEDGIYDMFGKEVCDKMRDRLKFDNIYNISSFIIQIDL